MRRTGQNRVTTPAVAALVMRVFCGHIFQVIRVFALSALHILYPASDACA